MNKRAVAAASLIAALSLSSLAVGASAHEPTDAADSSATSESVTGLVTEGTNADGRVTYYLTPDGGEPIELSYGPSWFWGPLSPLEPLVGSTVTLVGHFRDGAPDDNASDMAQAQADDETPVMQVRSIVGMELREKGRPPWAGGPKVVGEAHPGFEDWDESQAAKATEKAAEKAANAAEKAAEKAANAQAKAAEKAANAAEKAANAQARAAEKAGRLLNSGARAVGSSDQ